jgi:hypothetical protein
MKKARPQDRPPQRALTRPGDVRAAAADVSEGFRTARSALGQITADLERLRRHASSLVKGAHRTVR